MSVRILSGDCREVLRSLPAESVHCVVTSPPYFGLRDYGTAKWEGGDPGCDHIYHSKPRVFHNGDDYVGNSTCTSWSKREQKAWRDCAKCGARRIDSQIGLESTIGEYVETMVAVFREVRRVLRKDGTLWLNLGSSYVSCYIESHEYVIRPDLTPKERAHALEGIAAAIAAAVPTLRQANAPAKPAMSGMLDAESCSTGALSDAQLPEMREGIHGPQDSCGARTSQVLQPVMCALGEPNAQENDSDGELPNVREAVQQAQSRDEEDKGLNALLLPGLLVQPQCERQSLSLDWRPARSDESRRGEVAQSGDGAGQVALSNMSRQPETGSPSHPSVRNSQTSPVGSKQRPDALSRLPRQISASRNGACRNPVFHSVGPGDGLEKISLPRAAIPLEVLHLFQPRHISKPKDDAMVPEQVALALRDDGWIVRQTIIWFKKNPMPESVNDRCTKAHEYLFMLSKSANYFYDAEAIKEDAIWSEDNRAGQGRLTYNGKRQGVPGTGNEAFVKISNTRNRRSVWEIATAPFPEAHFATFPPALVEPCIRAGTSDRGCCAKCGAPWVRETAAEFIHQHDVPTLERTVKGVANGQKPMDASNRWEGVPRGTTKRTTLGWSPSCSCAAAVVPATCLDPFGGAGTTGLVADRLGRNAILIELNPEYVAMAEKRLRGDAPLFAEVAAE